MLSLRDKQGDCSVVLFDDNSDVANFVQAVAVTPPSWWIIRNNRNHGIYKQIALISEFLTTEYVYIANSDMDYIDGFYDMLLEGVKLIEEHDTVATLYNSNKHAPDEDINENWLWKKTIGGPSVLMNQKLFREFLKSPYYKDAQKSWDWKLVNFLKEKGKRFAVSKKSYARHFGVQGINHPESINQENADLPVDPL